MNDEVKIKIGPNDWATYVRGSGGTYDEPTLVSGDLHAFDLPGQTKIINTAPDAFYDGGRVAYWDQIDVLGEAFPVEGSLAEDGSAIANPRVAHKGRMQYVPQSQKKRTAPQLEDSDRRHFLLGGEIITINWAESAPYFVPTMRHDPVHAEDTRAILNEGIDPDMWEYPRMVETLRLFGDNGAGEGAKGARRDMRWLMRYWKKRTGGAHPFGWYNTYCTKNGDGHYDAQNHYENVLWQILKYLNLDGTDEDFIFMIQTAMGFCDWSIIHSGTKQRNAIRYEKGQDFIGGTWIGPSEAKTWIQGIMAALFLCPDNPTLQMGVESFLRRMETRKLQWPTFEWGARIGAHHMANYDVCATWARLTHQDERQALFVEKGLAALEHYVTGIDFSLGFWKNHGNNGKADASPWMEFQVPKAGIDFIENHVPERTDLRDKLLDATERIWEEGVTEHGGRLWTRYRFHPKKTGPGSYALNGFTLQAMRKLAAYRGEWEDDFLRMRHEHWSNVGLLRHRDQPKPIEEMGYEEAEQGVGGNPKRIKIALMGAKTK